MGTINTNPHLKLATMSIEQKLGQLFTIEVNSSQVDEEFISNIRQYHFGNIVLSGRNFRTASQVRNMNREIQGVVRDASNGVPAMIMVDEEGGSSSQFPFDIIKLPGNLALGAAQDIQGIAKLGQILGNELSHMGFTMLLGPVLDLCRSQDTKIIGTRSYGGDPKVAAALGIAFSNGVSQGGCGCTFKHFPGYGEITLIDGMPCNTCTTEELLELDAYPFVQAIANEAGCMMVGHIGLPNVHKGGSLIPASISSEVINGFLRKRIGFPGVVIADGAVAREYSHAKSAMLSLKAGTDIILHNGISHQISVYKHVYTALQKGRFTESELDEHVLRILILKEQLASLRRNRINISDIEKNTCLDSILRKSITHIRDPKNLIPLQANHKQALIVSPCAENEGILEGFSRDTFAFGDHFALLFESAQVVQLPLTPTKADEASILQQCENADIVIIGSENAHEHPDYLSIINHIVKRKPTIVISLRSPYEAPYIHQDATVLGAFSQASSSLEATASVIRGNTSPLGRLPVTLP